MNTIITEKTDNGEVSFDVFSKLVENRILFVYGFIDDRMATDIAATLMYLDGQNDAQEISLYLNAEGGDIRSVFLIYDVMKMVHCPIKTYCMGSAMDEAALILAAGTKGMRYATSSSTICLSQLNHEGSHVGDIKNAELFLDQLKKDNAKLMNALSVECKKSVKSLTRDTERQLYLSATDAKKFGVVDIIIGGEDGKK